MCYLPFSELHSAAYLSTIEAQNTEKDKIPIRMNIAWNIAKREAMCLKCRLKWDVEHLSRISHHAIYSEQ